MAKEATSMKDAIKQAAASLENKAESSEEEVVVTDEEETEEVETNEEEETDDEVEEKKESTESEESEEDGEEDEETEEDEDLEKAQRVWKALNDNPLAVIQHFAKQIGVDVVGKGDTKKEAKEQAASIKDIVSGELGQDYAFLAEKIGSAIEKVLEARVDSRFQEQETNREVQFVENKVEALVKEDGLSDKASVQVGQKMAELFQVMPGNYKNEKELDLYVTSIYELASKNVRKVTKKVDEVKKRVKRQKQNLQDEEPSSVAAGDSFVSKKRPKDMTYRQAIEAAAAGIQYAD